MMQAFFFALRRLSPRQAHSLCEQMAKRTGLAESDAGESIYLDCTAIILIKFINYVVLR